MTLEDGSAGAVAGLLIRSGVLRRRFNSYFFRQSDDEVTLLETRLRLCLVISVWCNGSTAVSKTVRSGFKSWCWCMIKYVVYCGLCGNYHAYDYDCQKNKFNIWL